VKKLLSEIQENLTCLNTHDVMLTKNDTMKILFFDTETNGLPKDRRAIPQQIDAWPRILQLAWALVDIQENGTMNVCDARSVILNPGDIQWNSESAAIHGITQARVQSEGIPPNHALEQMKTLMQQAHVLVAHNMAFDKPILRAEYYRLDPSESFDWWTSYEYCTMESTKYLCKLPFANGRPGKPSDPYKLPKLVELHKYLFGNPGDYVFHDALNDVQCTIACFRELLVRRLVVPFDQWARALRVRDAPRDVLRVDDKM
jgi:DNA polymerase III epsilon subunit-like protein